MRSFDLTQKTAKLVAQYAMVRDKIGKEMARRELA